MADIAYAQGDVDAYMASYSTEQLTYGTIAADVARRLLDAGRVDEAMQIVLNSREDDNSAPRPAHTPLPHPRNRQRQLPLQSQFRGRKENNKGERHVDQSIAADTLIRARHISVTIPGQFSVTFNTDALKNVAARPGCCGFAGQFA